MRLTRTTPSAEQAITVEEFKAYCEVDHSDHDFLIASLIGAVHDYLDGPSGILGRAILRQTWLLELQAWPESLPLPIEPVSTVSVSWLDANGDETTLAASSYQLVTAPSARPVIAWERTTTLPQLVGQMYPVRVTMMAGAASASAVDNGLKTAMLMLAGHWYDNRAAVVPQNTAELPLGISALLARYRRHL